MLLQVSWQLAGKCAELTRCQSDLRQAHHMLAAAYAANAALQVRFQHVSLSCMICFDPILLTLLDLI